MIDICLVDSREATYSRPLGKKVAKITLDEGFTIAELVLLVRIIWSKVLKPAVRAAVTSKIQRGNVALIGYTALVEIVTT